MNTPPPSFVHFDFTIVGDSLTELLTKMGDDATKIADGRPFTVQYGTVQEHDALYDGAGHRIRQAWRVDVRVDVEITSGDLRLVIGEH